MPPYAKQETDYYCGPAVVQMLLARIGIIFTQEQLAGELQTSPAAGTTADAIVSLLAYHGLSATRRNGATIADIQKVLDAGGLAIVGYIGDDEPHYALVSSVTDSSIVLQDPYFGEAHTLTHTDFEQRWHDKGAPVYGERLLIAVA